MCRKAPISDESCKFIFFHIEQEINPVSQNINRPDFKSLAPKNTGYNHGILSILSHRKYLDHKDD